MSTLDRFCEIPIYRLLLKPESYLPQKNTKDEVLTLLLQLPNHNFTNHKDKIKNKPDDYYSIYYNSILFIETKIFCNTLLRNTRLNDEAYSQTLNYDSVNSMFDIIRINQFAFFRYLITQDVEKFDLNTGWFKRDFQQTMNIEEGFSILRKYQLVSKIISKNLQELKTLHY